MRAVLVVGACSSYVYRRAVEIPRRVYVARQIASL